MKHRFASYPFVAYCEVRDTDWPNAHLKARTTDLSHQGCYIDTKTPFANGGIVLVTIQKGDERFACVGTVVHSVADYGMGVQFAFTQQEYRGVLHVWLAELAKEAVRVDETGVSFDIRENR